MALTHYIELRVFEQGELTLNEVLTHSIQKIHGLLSDYEGRLGIGFPAYNKISLGRMIRLFGDNKDIASIYDALKRTDVSNYAFIAEPKEVPESISYYACFKKVKTKGSAEYRRSEKRFKEQGIWNDELAEKLHQHCYQAIQAPYINLYSHSTNQRFNLFIKELKKSEPIKGLFNSYGLGSNNNATVPVF